MSRTLLLAALLLASCGLGTLDRDEFKARYPYGAGPYLSLRGMQEGLAALSLGDVQVNSLNIDPERISALVQDPKNPQNYDTHQLYIDRGVLEPTPYQNPPASFAQDLFPLQSVEPQKLVAVFKKAKEDLKSKEVVLDGLSISKGKNGLEIYIGWKSPRVSGSSVYTIDGVLVRSN